MLKQIIFGIILSCTSVACYQVVQVSSSPTIGGSGSTFWDCKTKSVYYADYFAKDSALVLFRYDYTFNRHYSATIRGYSGAISNLIPMSCALNQFVAIRDNCVDAIYWNGFSTTAIKLRQIFCVDESYKDPKHVITYARADPKGRLYVGTASERYCDTSMPPEASLYRYDKIMRLVKNFGGIRVSSGMDWNVKTGQFYHKDACENSLMQYQWFPFTGELTNGRQVFQFNEPNTVAISMVVDKYGMLYVAVYGGSKVLKINPRTSTIVETYTLPATYPTSITFCGPLLDTLCVNTGNVPIDVRDGTVANAPITPNDGKMYLIKDISTIGHCDRRVCI